MTRVVLNWIETTPSERVADLRRSTLYARATEAQLLAVAERARRVRLPLGYELFRFGEPATQFAIVGVGLVELHRYAPDREDAILGLFGPNDTVGLPAILERGRYPISVVAGTRSCEVLTVEAGALLDRMPQDAQLSMAVTQVLLEHIRALRTKIDILSCANLSRGLATLFLDLGRRFGRAEQGQVVVPIELSRTRLAQILGARAETVIRMLGRWKDAGWVIVERQRLVLADPQAVSKLLVEG